MSGAQQCSFCGLGQSAVEHIVGGPSWRICNNCVDVAAGMMTEAGASMFSIDQTRADLAAWRSLAHDLAAELLDRGVGGVGS